MQSTDHYPWAVRGIKVHGVAEVVERDGFIGPGQYLVITPQVTWSWGAVKPTWDEGGFAVHKIDWTKSRAGKD